MKGELRDDGGERRDEAKHPLAHRSSAYYLAFTHHNLMAFPSLLSNENGAESNTEGMGDEGEGMK
jgi:hypothetical protein